MANRSNLAPVKERHSIEQNILFSIFPASRSLFRFASTLARARTPPPPRSHSQFISMPLFFLWQIEIHVSHHRRMASTVRALFSYKNIIIWQPRHRARTHTNTMEFACKNLYANGANFCTIVSEMPFWYVCTRCSYISTCSHRVLASHITQARATRRRSTAKLRY